MHLPIDSYPINRLEVSIISALAYFDLFDYPITKDEIFLFMDTRCTMDELSRSLNQLEEKGSVYNLDRYYFIKDDNYLVEKREKGAVRANDLLKIAQRASALLIKFPFVTGVAVSGSLSKNYADEDSGIEYFIITASGKLWIARTMMMLFRRLMSLFHKEHFCMNYCIDESHTEIIEKNIFTAIEIRTLIPVYGDVEFQKFFSSNIWTRKFLPNHIFSLSRANASKRGWVKILLESLFSNNLGSHINNWLMKITAKRWQKKAKHGWHNSKGMAVGVIIEQGFIKPDPVYFQPAILEDHKKNLQKHIQRLGLSVM